MKICRKCDCEKQLEDFAINKNKKDGRQSHCKACQKEWRDSNQQLCKDLKQNWNNKNKERVKENKKKWSSNNKDRTKNRKQAYSTERKKANSKRGYIRKQERIKNDPIFRLRQLTSTMVANALRRFGYSKSSKTHQIIGCSFEELQEHLVLTAISNYGSYIDLPGIYHIDHIIPISSATTEEEVILLNHFSNLQYLYPEDNLKKSDSLKDQGSKLVKGE